VYIINAAKLCQKGQNKEWFRVKKKLLLWFFGKNTEGVPFLFRKIRAAFIALKYAHVKDFFKQNMKKVLKFTRDLTATYMFKEFFKMLLEYMQRRAQIEKEEFDDIVDQNLDDEMATKKVFKTTFEVVKEEGKLEGLRQGVLALLMATTLTNAQIAKMLDVEETFVKTIRQEFMTSKQQS
jgi:cysteinyl-tRNA synthetase